MSTYPTTTSLAASRPMPGRRRSLAWAGYAAFAWAAAYAVFVRGYHAAGGTVGLPGRLEDPDGLRTASLVAGIVILAAGVGALAFVRSWGLRLPRLLVVVPALAGSAFAVGHALTGYVTKTLDLLGVIRLEFPGWAQVDEHALILWDLLFYEPWFLGLGVLVTLGAVHHHRRSGGSARALRRLLAAAATGTLVLTALACADLIARG
jgi:hypothetical protein